MNRGAVRGTSQGGDSCSRGSALGVACSPFPFGLPRAPVVAAALLCVPRGTPAALIRAGCAQGLLRRSGNTHCTAVTRRRAGVERAWRGSV
ncbi:hypothetical protein NDU88_001416 [Pleurodeles waltl]|uniref:Uncharacterized protein n=1 Tax=Pleurodeles waltl TaxID=8319 RepID=A0AAV7S7K5_PLEWA|nr:hypothetical protein NDU88_001416 [Pleurodeles waltl]